MKTGFELHGGDDSPSLPAIDADAAKTLAETAQNARPWFMAISLGSRPRCFGCGGRMLPKVVVVQADHAICELCSSIDWSDLRPSWHALESLGSPLELTRSRGITFWTPPASLPDQDAYLRWVELWEIMRRPRTQSA